MKKEDLRIVFFGTPDFAVESLDALVTDGYNVVGVVTMPDKPAGRGHKMLHSPVKQYAESHGLRLMQPVRLKDEEFLAELRGLDALLFIVIAFRMLPEAVWQMPPLGTFNLHASLLPRYRGAAPINRAVMNGDTVTGVTTFMLKHEIDTGDILQRVEAPIFPSDSVGDVHDRLMHIGAKLTVETVDHILRGDLTPIPQDMIKDVEPCPAPKIFAEDCVISWPWNAVKIHNLVRGLSPYPGARARLVTDTGDIDIKIFKTEILSGSHPDNAPGHVDTSSGHVDVATGDGIIRILELQPAGKKRMTSGDFLRGSRFKNAHFLAE